METNLTNKYKANENNAINKQMQNTQHLLKTN